MSITRGPEDDPPPEAYSRVTRDLAEVTRGFEHHLDALPEQLLSAYDCTVRPPSAAELSHLREVCGVVEDGVVVEPADPTSACLSVGRGTFEGGVQAVVATGRAVAELVPNCFCDGCGEDSESLVAQADELVQLAVRGFHEFRRPYVAGPDELLHQGPWLEHGYENEQTSASRAGHHVRGPTFSVAWTPWSRRGAAPSVPSAPDPPTRRS